MWQALRGDLGILLSFTLPSKLTKGQKPCVNHCKTARKKGFLLLLLVVLLQTAPGCWGRELDARAFMTAVAFDLTTEEGRIRQFLLSIQVPIPAKMAGRAEIRVGTEKLCGLRDHDQNVTTGIRQLQRQLDRELFSAIPI